MRKPSDRLLTMLDNSTLYRLIGDAWVAQMRPKSGEAYLLDTAEEIGRRESAAFIPCLRTELTRAPDDSVVDCVIAATRSSGTWAMPEMMAAELALRLVCKEAVSASAASRGARFSGHALSSPPA